MALEIAIQALRDSSNVLRTTKNERDRKRVRDDDDGHGDERHSKRGLGQERTVQSQTARFDRDDHNQSLELHSRASHHGRPKDSEMNERIDNFMCNIRSDGENAF